MTTIKIGDWVVWFGGNDPNVPHPRLVDRIYHDRGVEQLQWSDRNHMPADSCTLLTPYASIDEVKDGKAVVVDNSDTNDTEGIFPFPKAGTIVEIKKNNMWVSVENFPNGRWECSRFAPIPRAEVEVEVPVKKEPATESLPCPHPEWQGVWDYCGYGYRVTWQAPDEIFDADRVDGNGRGISNWQPGEFWKQIEPAPGRSVAHPADRRWIDKSMAHRDHLRTPWDPCDEG